MLEAVINTLLTGQPLAPQYHDHQLIGDKSAYRECHIRPDWLLIYRITETELILVLQRTGSHADLFDMY